MRNRVAGAIALAVFFVFGLTMLGPASVSAGPKIVKACGTVDVGDTSIEVDMTEVKRPPRDITCRDGRKVLQKFVSRNVEIGSVLVEGHRYSCYESRPGSVGWDFNCSFFKSTKRSYRLVAFGGGRRG